MQPFSKGVGKDLKVKLYESSRSEFQNTCFRILETIYPHIISSRELGSIDASGIDLYTRDYDSEAILQVFQCKGFELPEFSDNQLQQCLKSITSFASSPFSAEEFYLVINRHIKDNPIRSELNTALTELVSSGKAKKATLLETNTFINFVFVKLDESLLSIIEERNNSFRLEYKERMKQDFYLSDVPFIDSGRLYLNPSQYIKDTVYGQRAINSNLRCWTFIVSEFGFGKTSLLLNLPLLDTDKLYIYIPIAQFGSDAFTNEAALSRGILSILNERELDLTGDALTNLSDKLLTLAFTLLLRRNKNIVLLYDGLDEHHKAYTEEGLADIFNCASEFVCHSIFSVRKEFIDERHGNFLYAVGKKHRPMIFHLYLSEWKEENIINYLKQEKRIYGAPSAQHSIETFIDIVEHGNYERYFGDIPKRPLFLKMLSDDISRHGLTEINLTKLYEKYLINKFNIDRDTSVNEPKSGRLFREKGDIYTKIQILFRIMIQISGRMVQIRDGIAVLEESIAEQDIYSAIRENSQNIEEIIEIMMMSVLIPFDKRKITGFRAKFAHRSFQEYFTARYLIETLTANTISCQTYLSAKYSEGVTRFFIELLDELLANEMPASLKWLYSVHPKDRPCLMHKVLDRIKPEQYGTNTKQAR